MQFKHPYEWLTKSNQKRAFILLLILSLTVMAALRILDAHLKTNAAPNGILSYEFAGNLSAAKEMIYSWGINGQICAGLSLGLDFLFLIAYAGAIGLGCILIGNNLSEKFAFASVLAGILAWGQIGAALLDSLENCALINILLGSVQELWLTIAWYSAAVKFMLVGFGLMYIISGTALLLFTKNR